MSFNWLDYLTVARELAEQAQDPAGQVAGEARLRSAISRAYYAAFHTARAYLRDKDKDPSIEGRGNIHAYVRQQFKISPDRRRKRIGATLHRLLDNRQRADYEDTYVNLVVNTRIAIKAAERVIAALDALPPRNP